MPRNTDFVMFWWKRAAELVRRGETRRFGLITTNSLPQVFNRKVVAAQLDAREPLSIVFAIPDHPWYLGADMAAVRIAMTVGVAGKQEGQLFRVVDPRRRAAQQGDDLRPPVRGMITANLSTGLDTDTAKPLRANAGLCRMGVKLGAPGFIVSADQTDRLDDGVGGRSIIRPYLRNKDVTDRPRNMFVIDYFGYSESEAREQSPRSYQYLLQHVMNDRQRSRRKAYREKWWIFVEARPALRRAVADLQRYIVTPEVAKYRPFLFMNSNIVPDASLFAIATDDAYVHGVLSSIVHATWAVHAGGRLGVGNDPRYHNTRCFDPFPFPPATEAQQKTIRDLAERLDEHRKNALAAHQDLTLTGLYNVVEKLRSAEALTKNEQDIHERGLVSVMKHLHDQIDAAVFDAYGWPRDLSEDEILARLVELNKERRAEEANGLVRWLRPEYQAPAAKRIVMREQGRLDIIHVPFAAKTGGHKPIFPKSLPERITTIRGLLSDQPKPAHVEELARNFQRVPRDDVQEVLNALVALGLARRLEDNRYAP